MYDSAPLAFRGFEPSDLATVGPWLEAAGLGVPPGASHNLWGRRLQDDPRIVYRAGLDDGELVGFFRLDVAPDQCAEVTLLVAPERRRGGLGRQLLEGALAMARELGLRKLVAEVQEGNRAAFAFFTDAGFEDTGRRGSGFVQLERSVHRSAGQTPLEISP